MDKKVIVFSLVLVLSVSFVSAGIFGNFNKNKLTGNYVVGSDTGKIQISDDGWTDWINTGKRWATGDYLITSNIFQNAGALIEGACSRPEAIECRTADDSKTPSSETGQVLVCDLNYGLSCKNIENPEGCYDYEVRYKCPKGAIASSGAVVTVSGAASSTTASSTGSSGTTTSSARTASENSYCDANQCVLYKGETLEFKVHSLNLYQVANSYARFVTDKGDDVSKYEGESYNFYDQSSTGSTSLTESFTLNNVYVGGGLNLPRAYIDYSCAGGLTNQDCLKSGNATPVTPVAPPIVCGNGVSETGEQCDDANLINGDGCSNVCVVESDWGCAGDPSVCSRKVAEAPCADTCNTLGYQCGVKYICGKYVNCGLCILDATTITDNLSLINQTRQNVSTGNGLPENVDGVSDYDGYIIEFEDSPILVMKKQLEQDAARARTGEYVSLKLKEYSDNLKINNEKIQTKIINEISSLQESKITGQAISQEREIQIIDEFENVFNGISLIISDEEAKTISELSGIKGVYPNYRFSLDLYDSAPLIRADDVWSLDRNGNNCLATGEECLTGKGVKIAILDTGVDYNHPALGGCFGTKEGGRIKCKVVDGYDFANSFDINGDRDLSDCYIEDVRGLYCEFHERTLLFRRDKNNDGDTNDCYTISVSGNFCEEDLDPMDDNGHGTHVASIAAGEGVLKGIAPEAEIYSYKVSDSKGSGSGGSIIAALNRAVDPDGDGNFDDKVDVASISLGAKGDPDDPLSKSVDNAVDAGVVVVAAAGNSGPNEQTISSPGTSRKAITVGGIQKNGEIIGYSSRGPVIWRDRDRKKHTLLKPDVVAPGLDICAAKWSGAPKGLECSGSLIGNSNYVSRGGTSMATPHVAGAAALLKQKNPDWTPEEIKKALMQTAIPEVYDPFGEGAIGAGRIDILGAINLNKDEISTNSSIQESVEGDFATRGYILRNSISSCNSKGECTLFSGVVLDVFEHEMKISSFDSSGIRFYIDAAETNSLKNGETYILNDGSYISIRQVSYANSSGDIDIKVQFTFTPGSLCAAGCYSDKQCYDANARKGAEYCNLFTNEFEPQLQGGEFCSNDSECLSNKCFVKCTPPNVLQTISNSIRSSFSPPREQSTILSAGTTVSSLDSETDSGYYNRYFS